MTEFFSKQDNILNDPYQKTLDSLEKPIPCPTKKEEEQILKFSGRMKKFNEEHELGEAPRLKNYSTTPDLTKYNAYSSKFSF